MTFDEQNSQVFCTWEVFKKDLQLANEYDSNI